MATVETVRGSVDTDDLGVTLLHEHIFIVSPEGVLNFNHAWGAPWWDEEERVAYAIEHLQAVHDAGIRTIVDPTGFGLGRDVRRVARVNAEVDLNIVVCSGIYAFSETPSYLKYREPRLLADLFVREIREGIDDTGIRAAFLKCAVEEHGLIGDLPGIIEATAMAANDTGVPVMVHTNASAKTGLLALETLTGHGMDPARIVIAHAGDSNDMDYLQRIADTGAWLGLDRFNIPHFNPDEQRIETLLKLIEAGYIEQVHLAHDASTFNDFMFQNPPFADEHPTMLHIHERVLPALRERGVTDEQIDQMLVKNAARFFGG
jgi:phosphotriesterase-related protein